MVEFKPPPAMINSGIVDIESNDSVTVNTMIKVSDANINKKKGQITINSDSSTGSIAQVTLGGMSTAAPSPQLTVSAGTLSFGSVTVNTAATQSLTLTSTGIAELEEYRNSLPHHECGRPRDLTSPRQR